MSLVAHAAAIAGVFAASIATIKLPTKAPNQMMIPFFVTPPQLGTEHGGPKPKTAVVPPQPPKRDAAPAPHDVAPPIVPEHTATVADNPGAASDATDSTLRPGDGGPIGVPWGTKDSVGPLGPPSTASAAPPDVVYRVGADVKAPVVLRRVNPLYPAVAVKLRKSGFAIVECTIDKNGRIRDAHLVGSNFAAFEQPALDAVQQWQFAPGTRGGQPVDVQFELRVTFQIQ